MIWIWIALAIVLDGFAGLTGGILSDRLLRRHTSVFVAFAAGALLGAAFLDLLPECIGPLGRASMAWTFGGFVAVAAFESWLGTHHHGTSDGAAGVRETLPSVLLVSDALHNAVDGAVIAASFLASSRLGVVTALAVIAHEVPQEIGDYALLRRAGWTRKASLAALSGVQFTAVIGVAVVAIGADMSARLSARVLALAAGMFIHIGAADLLPEIRAEAQRGSGRGRWLGFAAGVLATVAVSFVL